MGLAAAESEMEREGGGGGGNADHVGPVDLYEHQDGSLTESAGKYHYGM